MERILLRHDVGTEAMPFVYHAVREHLQKGPVVVYVSADRPVHRARAALEEFGLSSGEADRMVFVDAFSARVGGPPEGAHRVDALGDLDAIAGLLQEVAAEHPDALLVLESLSTMVNEAGPERTRQGADALLEALDRFPAAVALFTDWGYEEEDLASLLGRFDRVLRLRGVQARVITNHYFSVEGPRGDSPPVLYRTRRPGGLYLYIPKIVVVGPFDAGKTTFVHAVSDAAVSTERHGTTVALDRGRVTMKGLVAEVFGTPGQERFDALLATLTAQAVGVVLVVDSTRPESFVRANTILRRVWRNNIPAVVAANKQDAEDALAPEAVARRLAMPAPFPVLPCVASDAGSAKAVLECLIDRILSGGQTE